MMMQFNWDECDFNHYHHLLNLNKHTFDAGEYTFAQKKVFFLNEYATAFAGL